MESCFLGGLLCVWFAKGWGISLCVCVCPHLSIVSLSLGFCPAWVGGADDEGRRDGATFSKEGI